MKKQKKYCIIDSDGNLEREVSYVKLLRTLHKSHPFHLSKQIKYRIENPFTKMFASLVIEQGRFRKLYHRYKRKNIYYNVAIDTKCIPKYLLDDHAKWVKDTATKLLIEFKKIDEGGLFNKTMTDPLNCEIV